MKYALLFLVVLVVLMFGASVLMNIVGELLDIPTNEQSPLMKSIMEEIRELEAKVEAASGQ